MKRLRYYLKLYRYVPHCCTTSVSTLQNYVAELIRDKDYAQRQRNCSKWQQLQANQVHTPRVTVSVKGSVCQGWVEGCWTNGDVVSTPLGIQIPFFASPPRQPAKKCSDAENADLSVLPSNESSPCIELFVLGMTSAVALQKSQDYSINGSMARRFLLFKFTA